MRTTHRSSSVTIVDHRLARHAPSEDAGDGLYTAATAWPAWSLTKDPTAVAVVSVAAFAPAFLATFVSASYADRYDRRKLMIATDLARVAVVAVAAVLLSLGLLNLPLLVVTTALPALIGAPFAPARNAIVTQIVPADRLQQANGLLQVAFRAAFFVGPLMLAPLGLRLRPGGAGGQRTDLRIRRRRGCR